MHRIRQFLKDNRGATAIEYAMIGGVVSIVILTALTQIGSNLQNKFYNGLLSGFQ